MALKQTVWEDSVLESFMMIDYIKDAIFKYCRQTLLLFLNTTDKFFNSNRGLLF